MSHEFEALVSHLYVVGGRAVTAPPPGALVQLCPPGAPRNRQRDAFFVLVLPTQAHHAQAVFYEQLARWAAEKYFEQKGAITAGLQTVLEALNNNLFQHNARHPRQPFYAHVICIVLREQEVFIARTDGAGALHWKAGGLHAVPEEIALSAGRPLGMAPRPEVQSARLLVEQDDVMALTGTGLFALPPGALRDSGQRGDIQATVTRLKAQPVKDATAIVLQFIPPDAPTPIPAPVSASAPVATPAPEEAPPPASVPVVAASPASQTGGESIPSRHVMPADREEPALKKRLDTLRERSQQGQQSLVEAAASAKPVLDEFQTESRNVFIRLARRVLRLLQRGLLRLIAGLTGLRRLLDKLLPEPEEGKPPSLPTPVAAGATLLIPVAVVLLVVAFALNTRDESAFERCLSQTREAFGAAEMIEQSNPERAQEAWFGVIEVANRCLARRMTDPVLNEIHEQAQLRLDAYAQVVRCPTVPIQDFPAGTILRGPILRSDVDLYMLDTSRSILYRDRLNDAGNSVMGDSEVLAQRGGAVGEFVIRDLVDMAWLTEGSVARSSVLAVLDKQGVLVTYSPTFPPATAQRLVGSNSWIAPVALDTWQGRLYILDPVANQIWRYQPSGGGFPSAPEEYFVGDDRPDISSAVDFAIDQTGNVFVLQSDGAVRKFYSSEEQFFQFSNLPTGAVGNLGSANTMFLDTGFISPGFYVLDAANQLIHETTLGGTFIQSYRAPLGMSLRDLGGLAVDSSAENMYVTARDVLYHIPKCR
ncbi:MAG: hypothetical protein JXN59_11315 [Anaerolineae bacterium]|nr:hypothetical protein [Anaerolineae bacterium]